MGILLLGAAPSGHKAQVNLAINNPSAYGLDYPFINVAKQSSSAWVYFGTTSEDVYSLINSDGYPTRMPTGPFVDNWRVLLECYMCADPWVLTWSGSADVQAQFAGVTTTPATISANRIEYTLTGASNNTKIDVQIKIFGITTTPSNIQLFRKSQESLLNAGQITAPHFISLYSPFGRMRFMDWQQTNGSMLSRWSERPLSTDMNWLGIKLFTSVYGGICTQSGNDYTAPNAVAGNPSVWAAGQMLQATVTTAPTIKAVTGFTNTNPAKVTVVGHGASTGSVVFFPPGGSIFNPFNSGNIQNNLQGNNNNPRISPVYTITVVDANNFTLNGVDATNTGLWGTYVTGGAVGLQIRFKAGLLPFKRILDSTLQSLSDGVVAQMSTQGPVTLVYDADFDCLVCANGMVTGNHDSSFGIPIEVACQVANECGVDPWVCIPHMAVDDYVTQMATTIKATLGVTRVWNAELSNEVWGALGGRAGFPQTAWAPAKGAFLWGLSAENALGQWYGWRFYNMMGLIATVYSGSMNRVRRQFGVWTVDNAPSETTQRFEAPATGLGAFPATRIDGIAIAPYYEIDRATQPLAQIIYNYKAGVATSNAALIASAFSDLDAAFNSSTSAWPNLFNLHGTYFPYWAGVKTTYSIPELTQYEGGWGVFPSADNVPTTYSGGSTYNPLTSTDQFNLLAAYQVSSNYATVLNSALADFKTFGGVFPSQFCLTGGAPNVNSMFGMIQPDIFGTPPLAYTTFKAFNDS